MESIDVVCGRTEVALTEYSTETEIYDGLWAKQYATGEIVGCRLENRVISQECNVKTINSARVLDEYRNPELCSNSPSDRRRSGRAGRTTARNNAYYAS
jgi:hypothetical protein